MSAGLPYLRSRRRLLALLLPALVLRALIPFGFMPVVAGGGMTIGFCPGEVQPPGIAAAHQISAHQDLHAGHHLGHGGDPGSSGAHHAPCLFAASASPAFSPAVLALAPSDAHRAQPVEALAARVFLPTILRTQSPRGPPAIA
jgi:hypothetical protein